jgi:hypothetical protein
MNGFEWLVIILLIVIATRKSASDKLAEMEMKKKENEMEQSIYRQFEIEKRLNTNKEEHEKIN